MDYLRENQSLRIYHAAAAISIIRWNKEKSYGVLKDTCNIFFFLMDKETSCINLIKKTKKPPKIYRKYTGGAANNRKGQQNKRSSCYFSNYH